MSATVLRCSLGDLPVLSGGHTLALRGNWSSTVACHLPDGAEALPELEAASLVFTREDGAEDVFAGAVRRSAVDDGAENLVTTIVGGAGLLLADVPPRDHGPGATPIGAGLIARGICDDTGPEGAREQLADGVEEALDALTVRRWTRFRGPAGCAIDLLADVLGLGWRMLPSGRMWLGEETWPEVEAEKRLRPDPDDGSETWATDGAPILPGVTLVATGADGEQRRIRVVEVTYRLDAGRSRATVRAAVSGDPPRRPALDLYRATYAATVARQDDDGTLQLTPDDARLGDATRGLRGVVLRVGIPGCSVSVPAGARLAVAFDGADPRGLFAAPLEQDPTAFSALALVGDSCGFLLVTAPPGGGACTISLSSTATGAPGEVPIRILGPGHKYAKGVHG